MNPHYDRYLVKKYAPLYRNRYGDSRNTLMCFGFEVGDGWFNIINELSYMLCSEWITAKHKLELISSKVGEKLYPFSTDIITLADTKAAAQKEEELRGEIPVVAQVKEKFGTLRFYTDGSSEEQYKLISFAEGLSARTCEVCGKPGKIRRGGWIKCLCNSCNRKD